MGRIPGGVRGGLMELFYGVYQRDADRCLDALITMGVLVRGRFFGFFCAVPFGVVCEQQQLSPRASPPTPPAAPAARRPHPPRCRPATASRCAARRSSSSPPSPSAWSSSGRSARRRCGGGRVGGSGRAGAPRGRHGRLQPPAARPSRPSANSSPRPCLPPPQPPPIESAGQGVQRRLQAAAQQGRGQGAPQGDPLLHRRGAAGVAFEGARQRGQGSGLAAAQYERPARRNDARTPSRAPAPFPAPPSRTCCWPPTTSPSASRRPSPSSCAPSRCSTASARASTRASTSRVRGRVGRPGWQLRGQRGRKPLPPAQRRPRAAPRSLDAAAACSCPPLPPPPPLAEISAPYARELLLEARPQFAKWAEDLKRRSDNQVGREGGARAPRRAARDWNRTPAGSHAHLQPRLVARPPSRAPGQTCRSNLPVKPAGQTCAPIQTPQNRAVVNLFRGPNRIESIGSVVDRLESGDLKLRVRALEAERALNRVQVRGRGRRAGAVARSLSRRRKAEERSVVLGLDPMPARLPTLPLYPVPFVPPPPLAPRPGSASSAAPSSRRRSSTSAPCCRCPPPRRARWSPSPVPACLG
jgi:hypothetical protein